MRGAAWAQNASLCLQSGLANENIPKPEITIAEHFAETGNDGGAAFLTFWTRVGVGAGDFNHKLLRRSFVEETEKPRTAGDAGFSLAANAFFIYGLTQQLDLTSFVSVQLEAQVKPRFDHGFIFTPKRRMCGV